MRKAKPMSEEQRQELLRQIMAQQAMADGANAELVSDSGEISAPAPGFDENDQSTWGNPGRNAPCPCGSGKKFKHCHGKIS